MKAFRKPRSFCIALTKLLKINDCIIPDNSNTFVKLFVFDSYIMYIKSHYDYVKMQSSVIRPNPSLVQ